jgi:hypothetical protein
MFFLGFFQVQGQESRHEILIYPRHGLPPMALSSALNAAMTSDNSSRYLR